MFVQDACVVKPKIQSSSSDFWFWIEHLRFRTSEKKPKFGFCTRFLSLAKICRIVAAQRSALEKVSRATIAKHVEHIGKHTCDNFDIGFLYIQTSHSQGKPFGRLGNQLFGIEFTEEVGIGCGNWWSHFWNVFELGEVRQRFFVCKHTPFLAYPLVFDDIWFTFVFF